jgi:hypothetical protein
VAFFGWLLPDDDTSKAKLLKSLLHGDFFFVSSLHAYMEYLEAKKQLHL